jgi:isocitrate dehydrogenase (NAD+)
MAKYTVVAMPGDGIGEVVLPEAIRVLDAVGFDAEYVHGDIGWEFWIREGNALPERTIELLESTSWACSAPSRPSRRTRRRWS